jgi:hypothetical protein
VLPLDELGARERATVPSLDRTRIIVSAETSPPVTESAAQPSPVAPVKSKRSLLRSAAPFVLAVVMLAVAARGIDFHKFRLELAKLNVPLYFAFVVAWTLSVCATDSFATVMVYRVTTPDVKLGQFYVLRGASYLPGIVNYHLGTAFLTYMMSKFFGVSIRRMAGATLLSYATWFGCLLGCMVVALPFTSFPKFPIPIILVVGALYLVLIAARPAKLAKISFLSPLFEAGVKGHAIGLAVRVPHLFVLVFGSWLSFYFFHVKIPAGIAALYTPILLVAVTLPLTPQGAGVRDYIGRVLFASFAPGGDPTITVAATATWTVASTIICALMGVICSRIVRRRLAELSHVDMAAGVS